MPVVEVMHDGVDGRLHQRDGAGNRHISGQHEADAEGDPEVQDAKGGGFGHVGLRLDELAAMMKKGRVCGQSCLQMAAIAAPGSCTQRLTASRMWRAT